MYRLNSETFPKMPEETQERIKKAVCAQIEYLDANGGSDMDNGVDLMSAGLGKFSYTKASGANGSQAQSIYAPRALRILAPTGLLYRGGGYYQTNTKKTPHPFGSFTKTTKKPMGRGRGGRRKRN